MRQKRTFKMASVRFPLYVYSLFFFCFLFFNIVPKLQVELATSLRNEFLIGPFWLQVIKALQTAHRTECQWYMLVDKVLLLEDVVENQNSHDCRFKHSFPPQRPKLVQLFFTPTVGKISLIPSKSFYF